MDKFKLNDILRKVFTIGGAIGGLFIIAVIILLGWIMKNLNGTAVSVFLIISLFLEAVSVGTVFLTEDK